MTPLGFTLQHTQINPPKSCIDICHSPVHCHLLSLSQHCIYSTQVAASVAASCCVPQPSGSLSDTSVLKVTQVTVTDTAQVVQVALHNEDEDSPKPQGHRALKSKHVQGVLQARQIRINIGTISACARSSERLHLCPCSSGTNTYAFSLYTDCHFVYLLLTWLLLWLDVDQCCCSCVILHRELLLGL